MMMMMICKQQSQDDDKDTLEETRESWQNDDAVSYGVNDDANGEYMTRWVRDLGPSKRQL